jgi:hypothetical protein
MCSGMPRGRMPAMHPAVRGALQMRKGDIEIDLSSRLFEHS